MDFIHYLTEIDFDFECVGGFISPEIHIHFNEVTISHTISSSVEFKIEKEIKNIGEIENFEHTIFNLGVLSVDYKQTFQNVDGFLSYPIFFQHLANPLVYEHIHDIKVNFKIHQDLIYKYVNSRVADNKVYFIINQKPTIIYNSFLIGNDIIGEINKVVKDANYLQKNVFKTISVYRIADFSSNNFYEKKWDFDKVEGFKLLNIFPVGNLIALKEIKQLDWAPIEEHNFTPGEHKNIGGIEYPFELSWMNNFVIEGTSKGFYFNLALNSVIKESYFGEYSLNQTLEDVGGLVSGPIKMVNVAPGIDVGYNYTITDVEFPPMPLLNVSGVKTSFVFINSEVYPLAYFNGWKNTSFKMHQFNFKVTVPSHEPIIKGFTTALLELFVKKEAIYTDIKDNNYLFVKFVAHQNIITKKEGVYRTIMFDKSVNFDKSEYPYYDFDVEFLSDWKSNPFSFEKLDYDVYLLADYKFNSILPSHYWNLSNVSFTAGIDFIENSITIKNDISELILFNNGGNVLGRYVYYDKNELINDIIKYIYVFLKQEYARNAYILYTQKEGIYNWTEETLENAINYMKTDSVKEATHYCQKSNMYPYGIYRFISLNSFNFTNEYLNINTDNSFYYDDVLVFLDVSSAVKLNEVDRYSKVEIYNLNKSKFISNFKVDNLWWIAEYSAQHIILEKACGTSYDSLMKFKINNFIQEEIIALNKFIYGDPIVEPIGTYDGVETLHAESYTTDIKNNLCPFFKMIFGQINVGGLTLSVSFSGKLYLNISFKSFELTFSFKDYNIGGLWYGPETFSYLSTININSSIFDLTLLHIDEIKNNIEGIIGNVPIDIKLNQGIINVGGHIDKYLTVWMQTFIPEAGDVSELSISVYDIIPTETTWEINLPIVYKYVDENLPGENKPLPNKQDVVMPHIATMGLVADYPAVSKPKIMETELCKASYKNLDYSGFDYAIESDDKLLIGNNIYEIKKSLFGGTLTEKTSVFVANRYASDLGVFNNELVDLVQSLVEEPEDDNYTIDKFTLTSDDFGGNISQESLSKLNSQIGNLSSGIEKVQDVDNQTVDEFISSHPEYKEEINQYLNDLKTPADAYVWKNNPVRKSIDGKLFKKVKVEQKMDIETREDNG